MEKVKCPKAVLVQVQIRNSDPASGHPRETVSICDILGRECG